MKRPYQSAKLKKLLLSLGVAVLVPALLVSLATAADPRNLCYSDKQKHLGKYVACRLKAEAKATVKGTAVDFAKCDAKLSQSWAKSELKGGSHCPTEGDTDAAQASASEMSNGVANSLRDGAWPYCGDGTITDGEYCDSSDLAGHTCESLGFYAGGTLACNDTCDYDLTGCLFDMCIAPPGPSTTRYIDNGDGTITDLNTGLMWEKKTADGGLHDLQNSYKWNAPWDSVTTIWEWIDDVNAEDGSGFAGHTDWRIANVRELQFGAGISIPLGEHILSNSWSFWSSTTWAADSEYALRVSVSTVSNRRGYTGPAHKDGGGSVRAVRDAW